MRGQGPRVPWGLSIYRGVTVVNLLYSGTFCFLKTGVRDGPNKGKSFYVCREDKCNFVQDTE